jgi:hypothetical protein
MRHYLRIEISRKRNRKETKIQEFVYRDKTDVERELFDHACNKWSHRSSDKRFKEKFGSHTRKTFDRFATEDGYNWDFTHDTESITVLNLKPER